MIIKANELEKYMQIHSVDKIPVEVVNTDLSANKDFNQSARKLAKRLIITASRVRVPYRRNSMNSTESVLIEYAMYNSFKKSQCYVPLEWEFDILVGELGGKILDEFVNHNSNLEQSFRNTFAKVNPEIQEKILAAAKLLGEAKTLSEDHGLPFSPETSLADGMILGYIPKSFDAIYGELTAEDSDVVNELTGVYNNEHYGWQNSSSSC